MFGGNIIGKDDDVTKDIVIQHNVCNPRNLLLTASAGGFRQCLPGSRNVAYFAVSK
jgi:hypothetical protein